MRLNTDLSSLAEMVSGTTTGSVTVATNSQSVVGDITLSKGRWIVVACVDSTAIGSGYIQLSLSSTQTAPGNNPSRNSAVTAIPVASSGDKQTYFQHVYIQQVATQMTLRYYVSHTVESDIVVYPYIYAIRVG